MWNIAAKWRNSPLQQSLGRIRRDVESGVALQFETLRCKKYEDNPGKLTLYAFQKSEPAFFNGRNAGGSS